MKTGRHASSSAAAALLLAGLLAIAPSASAVEKMFKCVIDKRTVYQQQACPANAEPAASEPAPAAAPPPTRSLKPASRAASAAPATPR